MQYFYGRGTYHWVGAQTNLLDNTGHKHYSLISVQKILDESNWVTEVDLIIMTIMGYIIFDFTMGVNMFSKHVGGKDNQFVDLLPRWVSSQPKEGLKGLDDIDKFAKGK